MIRVLRNVGITIGGIAFLIFMIKIGVDPDNKSKYIKLAKHTVIASVLITLSLSLLEIPQGYFGSPVGIADESVGEVTFGKIEDKDCQGFWKGYYADIDFYRDADGFIFPTFFTYDQYKGYKGEGGAFTNNGGAGRSEEVK